MIWGGGGGGIYKVSDHGVDNHLTERLKWKLWTIFWCFFNLNNLQRINLLIISSNTDSSPIATELLSLLLLLRP